MEFVEQRMAEVRTHALETGIFDIMKETSPKA